jgi:hypothetical protein
MEDFRAEMERRAVRKAPTPTPVAARAEPPHGTRSRYIAQRCRCGACRIANAAYVAAYNQRRAGARGGARRDGASHGNNVVRVAPCGVHPLHLVKVRASGARSGCPMCAMQIEDLCRSFAEAPPSGPPPREHRPLISADRSRIVGCACGWRTPPGTADSEDAYVEHATVAR